MSTIKESTIKERIAKDLEQVKEKGSVRTQRIREIVKVAVNDAIGEVKGGSVEIRSIAQDAVTTVIEHLKGRGQQAKNEVMAAMEGAVAGVRDTSQITTDSQDTINPQDKEQQILEAVDGALVAVENNQPKEPRRFIALLLAAFNILKEKLFTNLQKENISLQELLVNWDGKLTEKYGDRYTQVKQRWETAQTSYHATKTRMQNGEPSPVDTYQAEAEDKAAKAGTSVAQTEQAVKQQLKTFLHSTADKI